MPATLITQLRDQHGDRECHDLTLSGDLVTVDIPAPGGSVPLLVYAGLAYGLR
jgi:hypothetical protein